MILQRAFVEIAPSDISTHQIFDKDYDTLKYITKYRFKAPIQSNLLIKESCFKD